MHRIALHHLETLLWIARLGTFSAAAERLNTTQPAISARVRELESQLGIAIFRRDGRRMALTVRGRQLVRDCEPLWFALERALLGEDGLAAVKGIVRVGAGEIAAASCLPSFVDRIDRLLPGVTLEIALDLTAKMLEHLLSGMRDIVFLAGPVASPGILTRPIGSVRLLWLASPATVAATDQTGDWPSIWSLPRHSPLHQVMLDTSAAAGIAANAINSCNNVRTMIDIIVAGRAMALFPETMVRSLVATGALVEILPQPLRTILFQVAIRSQEADPIILEIFRQAEDLLVQPNT